MKTFACVLSLAIACACSRDDVIGTGIEILTLSFFDTDPDMKTAIALSAFAACLNCAAPAPDYVTTSGVGVYDPAELSSAAEVQAWIDVIEAQAPADPVAAVLEGATITLDPDAYLDAAEVTTGEAVGTSRSILLAWRECDVAWPTAGALAHEVGHLLGYHHDAYGVGPPWFYGATNTTMETSVGLEVCGR